MSWHDVNLEENSPFWSLTPTEETEIEESVGQRLLDMEEEKQRREKDLESLEEQLRQGTAKSQITDSELQ